jgi:hypothetical protein
MAIIQTPPTSPVLTDAQKKARVKSQILGSSNQLFRQMVNIFSSNMQAVWNNADGLTPQQVMDIFGTDAGALVTGAAGLAALINATVPTTVNPTAPQTLTVNEDGTVTVGTPESSSSSSSESSSSSGH